MAQDQPRQDRNRDGDPRAQRRFWQPGPSRQDRHYQHRSPLHRPSASTSSPPPSSAPIHPQDTHALHQPEVERQTSPKPRPRSPHRAQDDPRQRNYIRSNDGYADNQQGGGDGNGSSTAPKRSYAYSSSGNGLNDRYTGNFPQDRPDWRRSPPHRASPGPASHREGGASSRESDWQDISAVTNRFVGGQRERDTLSDTFRSAKAKAEDAKKPDHSWRDHSPTRGSLRQREPRKSPPPSHSDNIERAVSPDREDNPSAPVMLRTSSASSAAGRRTDSDLRTEARRAASRSAVAHDNLSGGLVYDEDYTAGNDRQYEFHEGSGISNERTTRADQPAHQSVADEDNRDEQSVRSHSQRTRSRSRETAERRPAYADSGSSSRRERPRYDGRRPPSPPPHRAWRNGRIVTGPRLSPEESIRIPTGPKADRREDQDSDRRGNATRRTDEPKVSNRLAPPAEAPRGPRYPERADRPYDRRADQRRHERGWREDRRDDFTDHYTSRARVRDQDIGDQVARRSGAGDSGPSRPRAALSGRPPPPPTATADSLAYGSVSPEVIPHRDSERSRSRERFHKLPSTRQEANSDRRRPERSVSETSARSRRDLSPSNRRSDLGSAESSGNNGFEINRRKRPQVGSGAHDGLDEDNHTVPRRERRRRESQTSRTPQSPSRSPSLTPTRGKVPDDLGVHGSSAISTAQHHRKEQTNLHRSPTAATQKSYRNESIGDALAPVNDPAELPPETGDPLEKLPEREAETEEEESGPEEATTLTSPPRALPSELYTRIAQVGEGTYGQVFKAKSERTNVLVALKKIRMEAEKDGFPITAMREIKLLQMLRHRNVVRLHEIMTARGSVYMVFEYMEHDLNGVLNHPNVHFSPAHLKSLASQLLEGLGYLHHKAVLHRDLKGSNVLLNNAGLLKLADFGLARLYAKGRSADYTNRVVTLWYRPPELLLGATKYGAEVDIWGAGCIFLELFHRRPIFQGTDEISQLQVISDLVGPLSGENCKGLQELPWWELVRPRDGNDEVEESGAHEMEVDAEGSPSQGAAVEEKRKRKKGRSSFKETYAKNLSPGALRLADSLLNLDPSQRVTAAQALQMDYFVEEEPKARLPHKVLSALKGEWHELESKRARQRARG